MSLLYISLLFVITHELLFQVCLGADLIELSTGDVFAEKGSNQDTLRLLLEGRVMAEHEDGTFGRSYLPSVVHGAPGLLASGLLEPEQLIATTPCAVLLIPRGLFLMAMVKFGIVSQDSSEKWAVLEAVPCLRSLPPRYASQLTHAMTPCEFIRGESVIPLGNCLAYCVAHWVAHCVAHCVSHSVSLSVRLTLSH